MSRTIGFEAESKAVDYLKRADYQIIARNFNTRYGEVDIIALKDGILIFVEVKYRQNNAYGKAYQYVTASKIQKIKKAAWIFIKQHKNISSNYHIDVIAINGDNIEHYQNITL